jgi:hypothetical protein
MHRRFVPSLPAHNIGTHMKSMFETGVPEELLARIGSLSPSTQHRWGKMGVAQMMAHVCTTLEVASGKRTARRLLIGRILGPIFRKRYYDDSEFTKNGPTHPTFVVTGERDFAKEKERLLRLVREFAGAGEAGVTKHPHSFFGTLSPAQWGIGTYKHLDHHLRQFGA